MTEDNLLTEKSDRRVRTRTVDWSFVIPCLNEERNLPETIRLIHRHVPRGVEYEIIIADHGSTDRSAVIATEQGAIVVTAPNVLLGELRNVGVRASTGSVLIFLDADTSLTLAWERAINATVSKLSEAPLTLTGSMALPDPEGNWVSVVWEAERSIDGRVRTLGGAHMIIRRDDFWAAGGFPEEAETGEDEQFSVRVWNAGGQVVSNPQLEVIHREAPQTLTAFMKRTFWHGSGDAKTIRDFLSSRMAIVSVVFVFSHILLIGQATVGSILPTLFLGAVIVGFPALLSWRRLKTPLDRRYLGLTFLFYLALWSRGLAALLRPLRAIQRRRRAKA